MKKNKTTDPFSAVLLLFIIHLLPFLFSVILPLILQKTKEAAEINFEPTRSDENLFYAKLDNVMPKMLTIEQLRKYKGQENISEEEALEKIEGLYKLSLITYKIYSENGTREF